MELLKFRRSSCSSVYKLVHIRTITDRNLSVIHIMELVFETVENIV